MRKNIYEAPSIETLEIRVEQGFAQSNISADSESYTNGGFHEADE